MIAIEAVTTTGATAALCQSVGLARSGPPNARRCSTCCTASGSSIWSDRHFLYQWE